MTFNLKQVFVLITLLSIAVCSWRAFGFRGFIAVYDVGIVLLLLNHKRLPWRRTKHEFVCWIYLGLMTAILHAFLLPSTVAGS